MAKEKKCSFCGKNKKTVIRGNVDGVESYICFDCLEKMNKTISSKQKTIEQMKFAANLKPSSIKSKLDEYVVDQDICKSKLAVAIYNHYKLNKYNEKYDNNPPVNIQKSNVLFVGPTGSGKTLLIQTIAKELGIALSINDATSFTEAGYVGNDVENCLLKLIQNADGDIKKAEKGIVYIDEIDKICRKGENVSITRDVGGEGVQQALLKLVEGTVAEVPPKGGRKHPEQECIKIDTSNILFIVGGSFEGIEKIIAKRQQGKSTMGFGTKIIDKENSDFNELISDVTVEDLKKFGMLPEFLGRFPVIASLNKLNEQALIDILVKPKNAITKQYQELLRLDNVELEFEEAALKEIAQIAIKRDVGARSLKAIIDETLLPYLYEIPDHEDIQKVIITKDTIDKKGKPIYIYREEKEEIQEA